MSDLMLLGALRMPRDIWGDVDSLDAMQRESRYKQAADRIEADEAEITRLTAELAQCKADAGRYRWLRRGDVDCDRFHHQFSDDCHPPSWQLMQGETLDAAIDAARSAESAMAGKG